jgi:outer membrane protein OmpA-like peptidoglycan-associated protein/Mg-chelatase subunit ChlD
MKRIAIALFCIVFISGCRTFVPKDELPLADRTVTLDCPGSNNDVKVFMQSGISSQSSVKDLQISSINTDLIGSNYLNVRAFVHPLDENGNFVDGLENSSKWCMVSDSNSFKTSQIKNFKINKITKSDKEPVAVLFVLDHSGSVGEDRARIVQSAIKTFINKQIQTEDWVGIIKFDTKNSYVEVNKSDKVGYDFALQEIAKGLDGFGNATALYDAISDGIDQLDRLKNYSKKSLIVFTDGYENSSTSIDAGKDLIPMAKMAGISINTVGFADNVDRLLLADTLAMATGGVYQHICKTEDFNIIFSDLYNRIKSYYEIEYSVPKYFGYHTLKLKLCNGASKPIFASNSFCYPEFDKELPIPIDVYFDFGKSNLKMPESKIAIDIIDTLLKSDKNIKIEIQGHTDSVGTPKANQMLSENRAKAVMNELLNRKFSKDRITAVGFGETQPMSDNTSEEGRAVNRRVVFIVKSGSSVSRSQRPNYKSPTETSIK